MHRMFSPIMLLATFCALLLPITGVKIQGPKNADKQSESDVRLSNSATVEKDEDASKQLVSGLFAQLDKDADGFLTEPEVNEWLMCVQNETLRHQVRVQWKDHPKESGYWSSSYFSWEFISKEMTVLINAVLDPRLSHKYERRFKAADKDGDGFIFEYEFGDYLHPSDDILVMEVMETMDNDQDGKVSDNEARSYLISMGFEEDAIKWYKTTDLTEERVRGWLFPAQHLIVSEQTGHLFAFDEDKDLKLSESEVQKNYHMFLPLLPLNFEEENCYTN